ncbi:hypothetical protein [Kribbella sp. VKM Ac-2568]|nr:hypothetical protein [Kribbella sp. VKM Ac-2568]TCM50596.1 hypothetical protein EV648_102640 [Kribbella sp. VKM Ac-2568]
MRHQLTVSDVMTAKVITVPAPCRRPDRGCRGDPVAVVHEPRDPHAVTP